MIEFNNVSFKYRGKRENNGIKNIDFHIKKGETILICGGSGCGKSTVTRIINGLIPHFYLGNLQGEVKINSEDINGKTLYEINEHTGSVFQNPRTQFFNLDTDGELVFGGENRGEDIETILANKEKAVKLFGLSDLLNRNIHNLSGGQQQKIACASIYCTDPDIFVMDEPTSNLDSRSIEDLKNILRRIKQEGRTIVIAEHRLYFLMDIADRIFYMKDGRLEKIYTAEEFKTLSVSELESLGLRSSADTEINKSLPEEKASSEYLEIRRMKVKYHDNQSGKNRFVEIKDLKLPLGEIIGITGENGIGKSTFAKALSGLQKGAKSEIYLRGKLLKKSEQIKSCFLVMQDVNHQLFTEKVREEIKLGADSSTEAEINELIESFDLAELQDVHPMDISGGQKQRVITAAAINSGKKILILDEPTSGLDFRQMKNVSEALKKVKNKVDLIIVISHDMEFVNSCCTMAVQLDTVQTVK